MLRLFIVVPHAEREDYDAACHRPPSPRYKKIRKKIRSPLAIRCAG
jgi:hypothetical protein